MKQLISPNPNQTGKSLWCLKFAGDVFSLQNRPYDYATQAWNATKYKHQTDVMPDVAVPVWFTWTGTIDKVKQNWGDVAVWVPGVGVIGSPLKGKTGQHRCANVYERAKAIGGGAQYLGWSEDLNDIRLVKPGGDMSDKEIDTAIARMHINAFGSAPSDAVFEDRRKLFKQKGFVEAVNQTLNEYESHPNALKNRYAELNKVVKIQQNQIESLKAQVGDNSKFETLKALIRELFGIKGA